MRDKGGTLLLSNISLGEFAGPSDPQHAIAAEAFIERLLPNIYLTDFAFDKILEREHKEPDNVTRFWPSADLPQLKLLAERTQNPNLGVTMQGFIRMSYQNRVAMIAAMNEVVQQIVGGIKDARADPSYISKAKSVTPDGSRPRTLNILSELTRGFYLDLAAPIRENDIVDMLHAIMPINCCDYVLLDGAWAERVEKMKHRIEKFGAPMRIAKCFSKRNQGVHAFLSDLEEFDQHNLVSPAVPY
ncbi:hypothetical protein D3872_20340 [Massilia cavernae]|uniref:Uncharacterized protein n=2 Tax=Massilia cavernae TaxID=2320864 RepID=A0A418XFV1_9BURK|nr:hypothetical protein D3872_20340 [Massilia cavernae]